MAFSFDDLEDVRRKIVSSSSSKYSGLSIFERIDNYIRPWLRLESFEEEWRLPVYEIDEEPQYMYKIKSNTFVKNMNFNESDFARQSEAATCVLGLVRKSMQYHANERFPGLQIGQFIYQGSSRDGLKVGAPDEYDALLEFSIKGLRLFHDVLEDIKGNQLSEFAVMYVEQHSLKELQKQYRELYFHGIFEDDNGTVLLNSRKMYEGVFVSLVDKACTELTQNINVVYGLRNHPFKIDRKSNQPSINIRVFVNKDDNQTLKCMAVQQMAQQYPQDWDGDVIDIDIVPGIRFGIDQVPYSAAPYLSSYRNRMMDCPRHCVFKWKHDNQTSELPTKNSSHLWRVCTSTYELCVLDASRVNRKHTLVLTALRILKAYLRSLRSFRGHQMILSSDSSAVFHKKNIAIANILRSYHLKHIAFYCLLYLCEMQVGRLDGVGQAVSYMLDLLEVSLEEGKLPHFFHNNPDVRHLLPKFVSSPTALSFDLYASKKQGSLTQALASLRVDMRRDLEELISDGPDNVDVKSTFKKHIRTRKYFKKCLPVERMSDKRMSDKRMSDERMPVERSFWSDWGEDILFIIVCLVLSGLFIF